jgi:uncharacterized protein (DUF2147 family)
MKRSLFAILFAAFSASALAQMSPAGLWKTIDDDTQKEKSLVRIKDVNGVFTGSLERLLDPTHKNSDVCDKCTDERKDKPVLGMTIIRNIKASADDKGIWDGGDVLDPNNGKVYRARLKPVDGGKKLEMRGYIGPFYRTQVWLRVE